MKKRIKGNYILLIFVGDLRVTNELERILKLDDRVLKYLTVRVEKQSELELLIKSPSEEEEAEEEDTEEEDTIETDTEGEGTIEMDTGKEDVEQQQ